MLKKMLLCLMVLMLVVPAGFGEKEVPLVSAVLPEDSPVRSLLPCQEGFLVYTAGGLYQFVPGQPRAKTLVARDGMGEPFVLLIARGDQLWGLDAQNQALIPLRIQKGSIQRGSPLEIPLRSLLEDQLVDPLMAAHPSQALVQGECLLLCYERDEPMGYSTALLSFDLNTGEGKAHEMPTLQALAQTPEGGLLALTQDTRTAFNMEGQGLGPLAVQAFDPDTDTLGEARDISLPQESLNMLAVAPDTGFIYLASREKIYRLEDDNSLTFCTGVNYSRQAPPIGALMVLPGERMIIPSDGEVRLVSLNPEYLPKGKLKIVGDGLGLTSRTAAKAMTPAVVENLGYLPYNSAPDIAQAFLAGNLEADILMLESANYDLDALKKKGYCLDLSASPILMDYIGRLSPQLQELAMQEEKLFMLPIDLYSTIPGYFPKVFQEVGIPVPTTLEEFVGLLETWQREHAQTYPDYTPFQSPDPLQELIILTMGVYADACYAAGEAFSFDSPALKEMMYRLDAIFQADPDAFRAGKPLIELRTNMEPSLVLQGFSMDSSLGALEPLPLRFKEGLPPYISNNAWVWMVQINAAAPELAIQYLEEYTKVMEPFTRVKLFSGYSQEVEDPLFKESWKGANLHLQELEAAAARAEGAEKSQAQQKVDDLRKRMEYLWEAERILIDLETLNTYQLLMKGSRLQRYGAADGFFVFRNGPAISLLLRYSHGQIGLEQLLRECQQRYRLMQMEAGE